MTPKEKAVSILNKMTVDFDIDKWQSKQCALVAVDEIILEQCKSSELKDPRYQDERLKYWNTVKAEIEKS